MTFNRPKILIDSYIYDRPYNTTLKLTELVKITANVEQIVGNQAPKWIQVKFAFYHHDSDYDSTPCRSWLIIQISFGTVRVPLISSISV